MIALFLYKTIIFIVIIMMKHYFSLIAFIFSVQFFAQSESLELGEKYLEDQLYILLSYNSLNNQPIEAGSTGFSYGFSTGYIKDIPLTKKGNWSLGLGLGYGYDNFKHELVYDNTGSFTIDNTLISNKFSLHNIELPIQFRWRTSDAVTYSFWRIYAGFKLSYNLHNSFNYIKNSQDFGYTNISNYRKFQTGLEISLGYSAFNFYMFYGLTPIYKNTLINGAKVNSKMVKFGLIIYLL